MNEKKPIEETINENIDKCNLDRGLADAYASLGTLPVVLFFLINKKVVFSKHHIFIACYIKDKYKYIANLLFQHSTGSDQWAAWFMCIAVIHPQEWPKVNEAFKTNHKQDSLSKFILVS